MNPVTYLYYKFPEALDAGKEVLAEFCDISKAFDRLWHEGLIYKLKDCQQSSLDGFKAT